MSDKKYLLTAISTVAAASFSLSAMASQNTGADPFQAEDLPAGFQVSADDHQEGKCGEGNCGEEKDEEGQCGEDDKDEDKDKDDKDEEGSCGEGSCGEGSCGQA